MSSFRTVSLYFFYSTASFPLPQPTGQVLTTLVLCLYSNPTYWEIALFTGFFFKSLDMKSCSFPDTFRGRTNEIAVCICSVFQCHFHPWCLWCEAAQQGVTLTQLVLDIRFCMHQPNRSNAILLLCLSTLWCLYLLCPLIPWVITIICFLRGNLTK